VTDDCTAGGTGEHDPPSAHAPTVADETPAAALHDLRRTRRRNRVAELEWFEVAYRVYLVALGGGGLVLWASAAVQDDRLGESGLADVRSNLPPLLGLVAALVLFLGLRSGARGGPLAIEEPEVRIVLLAPVERAVALRRPAFQRVRTLLFAGSVVGAVAAQLLGRRIDGGIGGWVVSGAVAGGTIALAFAGAALVAHGLHVAQWQATAVGAALLAVQGAALAGALPAGPFDTVGSIVLWPDRISFVDVIAPIAAMALTLAGFAVLGRLSLEQLVRRSALVAQLRFAVTLQDVRTVTLLRRQLSLEHARHRPWFRVPGGGPPSWRRGWASIARFPGRRIIRMLLLTGAGVLLSIAAYRGTTPAIVPAGLMAFLLGLEALEPLAQELDHPERTDALPVAPGRLHQRLTIVPAIVLLACGCIGAAGAMLVGRGDDAIATAAILGPTLALAGGAGAALNTIAGAPDPFSSEMSGAMLPPEVAGITMTLRLLWPPLVAVGGVVPVLLARSAAERGDDPVAGAGRGAIGVLVVVALVAAWVERRPAFKIWWQNLKLDASGQQTIKRSIGGSR
jgi:hypothetical protein